MTGMTQIIVAGSMKVVNESSLEAEVAAIRASLTNAEKGSCTLLLCDCLFALNL